MLTGVGPVNKTCLPSQILHPCCTPPGLLPFVGYELEAHNQHQRPTLAGAAAPMAGQHGSIRRNPRGDQLARAAAGWSDKSQDWEHKFSALPRCGGQSAEGGRPVLPLGEWPFWCVSGLGRDVHSSVSAQWGALAGAGCSSFRAFLSGVGGDEDCAPKRRASLHGSWSRGANFICRSSACCS